ncbi:hypothetical protein AKJ58_00650 [candidate division MSBL1 archaeon SCGC-AAA385D11]|uniref:DNA repair helicase n=1 Tax=candidate division MSBL1 archaeon SCGC-AAA385D11 TaxID=1698286 RepID=A0A133VP46_9EURY|nr:hypothetical protein AKJ58_00650 [candidate division MSBL1 archaeon SCGC-AAA385D11]
MTLKEINFKKCYDSDEDNILNEFYIPALSNSIKYHRLAGFFSSSVLALAARGIAQFIENGGHMELIASARLTKEDVEAITQAYKDPEKAVEDAILRDLVNFEEEFIRDHVRALGWMVANNRLDIKIAVVRDEDGLPLDEVSINNRGIFHQKRGILEDEEENRISFSGSDNESASAWQDHIEEFKVFRGWNEYEAEYLQADLTRFEKFWNGLARRTEVMEVPEAVERKLIEIAPKDIRELDLKKWTRKEVIGVRGRRKLELWPIQNEAVKKWFENGNKGIFEMATATGKTYAALGCLKKMLDKEEKLVTIIATPWTHLSEQWRDKINELGITTQILVADSSNPNWKNELTDFIFDVRNEIIENLVALTTHDTLHTGDFIDIINRSDAKLFLIVDEVHGVGSPKRRAGLVEEYDFRLGLSATPERWFDEEGTEKIFEFFGGTVFNFPLKEAIRMVNPAIGKTYLCSYDYKPYFVEMSEEELERYEKETRKIARAYYQAKDDEEKERKFHEFLSIRRKRIIKNADGKWRAFIQILDEIEDLSNCLVFCTPQQIDRVQNILNARDVIQHKFTQDEGTSPSEEYGGISQREFLLQKFVKGTYQVLVAMKCLDQGVDIPPAEKAIILASTGNPRQYIQRRGRVLRHSPGKEKATIYDIIVVPNLSGADPDFLELERKIVKKEFKRYKEFAEVANNALECLERIERIERDYGLI